MTVKNTESTIAYRCPHCGSGILSMVGVFALSGDMIKLKCDCGQSELIIQNMDDGKLRLTVPCMMCPRPHQYVISRAAFFDKTLFTLPCGMTETDVCFIGEKDAVINALNESEKELLSMIREAGYTDVESLSDVLSMQNDRADDDGDEDEDDRYDPNFTDNHIYDMVLYVIRELEEDGKIFCRCTEHGDEGDYDIICDRDEIYVSCKKCGARKAIRCNGALATQAFLDTDALYLEGMSVDSDTPDDE
ncbi:MAG: hypothetical protein MJ175_01280 [Clostridia bacterium]|nr:hypothetical protein [Clostridia bacterium]